MRVRDGLLRCIVYIYPSEADALQDEKVGASGFLVSVASETKGLDYHYVVTNQHVIARGGLAVCVNSVEGRKMVQMTTPDEWVPHPDGDDIAALPLPQTLFHGSTTASLQSKKWLLGEGEADDLDIGIGDEVFMLERFQHREGIGRMLPVVRFGNISAMPEEPVVLPTGTPSGCTSMQAHLQNHLQSPLGGCFESP